MTGFMGRILGLDGIRAYAVIMVVVTHLHIFIEWHNDKSPLYSLVWGAIGVIIFFILSGFLITHLLFLEYEKTGTVNLKQFIIRRGLRIFPAFYLFILILFTLGLSIETNTTPKQLFMAAIYWFNHTPRNEYNPILGHTWSLAVEEHFYIIWPLIFMLLTKIKTRGLSISLALIMMIYSLQILQNHLYAETDLNQTFRLDRWTSSAAIYLLSGCLGASFVHSKYWDRISNLQIVSIVLSAMFIVGFGVDFWFEGDFRVAKYWRIAGILSAILWVYINQDSKLVAIFEFSPIKYIGTVSYGIYLWQGFYLSTGPYRWDGQEWPLDPTIGVILLCITVPLSYHLFEKKFLKLKDRFRTSAADIVNEEE
jgi:peptidoglycan/LPS O-acetylase OafA/YrhL|tara:strand:+ start:2056 stop:3153 length:1098 start_codon:yes stop_codon:yes gene_type:complete